MENLIEATILTGPFEGEAVLIPRIPMIPTDLLFQFKRLQFPIRLVFAITINKAQGQSLEKCGIDLNTDCFSHGQLYVACSRVGKPDNLFICSDNWTAKNVVYSQVLCSSKNIYIYIYLNSQVGHRDTTTMARNDLRARGAWGGAKRPTN